jgi:hypothetical protein
MSEITGTWQAKGSVTGAWMSGASLSGDVGGLVPLAQMSGIQHRWKMWRNWSLPSGQADESAVSSITDLVGSADLVPSGTDPEFRRQWVGGRDGVYLDGTQGLETDSTIMLDVWSVLLIAQIERHDNDAHAYEFTSAATSGAGGFFARLDGTNTLIVENSGGRSGRSTASKWWSATDPHATLHVFGGTHASHTMYRVGPTEHPWSGAAFTDDPGTDSITDTLYVGSRAGSGQFVIGAISELVIFDHVLTSAERLVVDQYVRETYHVAVP